MAKLNNEKWKKSLFYEEKSLVGLTPKVYVNLQATYSLRLLLCSLVMDLSKCF